MSKVAKYRRQVSEDPDIDSLLSTLSPEEMEELEKELDVADPDSSIGAGLRQRNQAERQSTGTYHRDAMLGFCEKETKKLMQRELPVDVSALAGGRAGGAGDPVLARALLCRRGKPRGAGAASGGGRLPPRRLCAGGSPPPPAASSGDTAAGGGPRARRRSLHTVPPRCGQAGTQDRARRPSPA